MKKHINLICCTLITALTFCACDTNSDTGIECLNGETLTSSGVTDISAINATETKTAETDTKPRTTYTEIIADTPKTNETKADETTVKETEASNNSSPALKPTNTPRATNTPAPMPTNATPTPKPTETARSTSAPAPQATSTPMPTATPKPTNTPTPSATPTPEPHEHDWVRYPYMQSWDDNLGYIYYCECGEDYYENCYAESDPDREAVAAIVRVPTTVYGCNITTGYGTAWEDGEDVSVLVVREYVVQPKDGAYYHDPCIYDYEWYELYEDPEDLYAGFYEVYPVSIAHGYGTACIDGDLIGPELIGFVDEPLNYIPWY